MTSPHPDDEAGSPEEIDRPEDETARALLLVAIALGLVLVVSIPLLVAGGFVYLQPDYGDPLESAVRAAARDATAPPPDTAD